MPTRNAAPLAHGGGRSLIGRQYSNPFAPPSGHESQPACCISVAQFAEHYAAAEFAAHWRLWLDVSLTITWGLLGVHDEAQMQAAFGSFMKCLRAWLADRLLPQAWVYVHERGLVHGLHSHLALHVPGDWRLTKPTLRQSFRKWVLAWAERQAGRRAPYSTRVRDNGGRTNPTLHWVNCHYQMKSFDREAVVQSARNSPSGEDVMLGDLIAFNWQDPGAIGCKRLGVAQDLGPAQRKLGYPPREAFAFRPEGVPDIDVVLSADSSKSRPSIFDGTRHGIPKPFRSSFEDGGRAVGDLYPADFVDIVRHGHGILTLREAQRRAEQAERERRAAREEEALREEQEINDQLASLDI
jgi:hypothetical protein